MSAVPEASIDPTLAQVRCNAAMIVWRSLTLLALAQANARLRKESCAHTALL